jgi:hypothetical protein
MTLRQTALFRAHSNKYITADSGTIVNPYWDRERKPRDMPAGIHQLLSKWFLDRFGVNYRGNSLFCTGDFSIAKSYKTQSSSVILIDPIGNYSVCYSPKCRDLFAYYQFNWSAPGISPEKIWSDMDSLEFSKQQNSGLELAAESLNEVMLHAMSFNYKIIIR